MKKRLISSIVALAIFIPLIIIGGLAFKIAGAILAMMGVRELFNLIRKDNSIPFLMELISYILTLSLVLSGQYINVFILIIFVLLMVPLIFYKDNKYNFNIAIKLLGIVLFIGFSFFLIVETRDSSLDDFILILSIACATDIFALVGGKMLGKNKLIERISPNKTVEGSLVGTLFGVLIPTILYIFILKGDNILLVVFICLVLSITGQIGDLVFSAIKRNFKVKDYSNIMPGHGGVLDRLDSLIFITIVYTIIDTMFI